MEDLSLHILDVAENSLRAGATEVRILVASCEETGFLTVEIADNGRGMTAEEVEAVLDPFFTHRTERRVGLGLPLFSEAARAAGGDLTVSSASGAGTTVRARFQRDHVDRQPLGDLAGTMTALIAGYPDTDFRLCYSAGGEEFVLETKEVRERLEDVPIQSPAVLSFLRQAIVDGMEEVDRRP